MRKIFSGLILFFLLFSFAFAQTKNAVQKNLGTTNIDIAKLANATNDKNAPVVYFSRDISSESILKLYKATGKKLSGKIALKVIFEGPREQYLDPALLADLVRAVEKLLFTPQDRKTNRTILPATGGSSNLRLPTQQRHHTIQSRGFTFKFLPTYALPIRAATQSRLATSACLLLPTQLRLTAPLAI